MVTPNDEEMATVSDDVFPEASGSKAKSFREIRRFNEEE